MSQAVRSKGDFPDTMYYDDWFTRVSISDLIGKTVYVEPQCFDIDVSARAARKKLKDIGVAFMTKKDFDASKCDYIAVFTGWSKQRKSGLNKEQKLALKQWTSTGSPLRLYWKHIEDDLETL